MSIRRFLAIVLCIGVVGSVVTGIVIGKIVNSNLVTNERQLCERLNTHRVLQDDKNDYAQWKFDKLFLYAIEQPQPRSQQTTTSKHLLLQFKQYLQEDVNSLSWTPATLSCDHPGSGVSPIRFVVRQPTSLDLQTP